MMLQCFALGRIRNALSRNECTTC